MRHARAFALAALLPLAAAPAMAQSGNQPPPLLSDLVDVSRDFRDYTNAHNLADHATAFDPATGSGRLVWLRHQLYPRITFDSMEAVLRPFDGVVFPGGEYATNPELPFSITFVSPRTVRLRASTGSPLRSDADSLMLVEPPQRDNSWRHEKIEGGHRFTSAFGSVTLREKPWRLELRDASERGLPMLRALFVEFPEDAGSWLVEDEYLFGSDILVAPLMQSGEKARDVYVPPGAWIDYQTGRVYEGGWHRIEAGEIPVVMLVHDGVVLPHAALAQSTTEVDWSKLELVTYAAKAKAVRGLVCLPSEGVLREVRLTPRGTFLHDGDPLVGRVTWHVRRHRAAEQGASARARCPLSERGRTIGRRAGSAVGDPLADDVAELEQTVELRCGHRVDPRRIENSVLVGHQVAKACGRGERPCEIGGDHTAVGHSQEHLAVAAGHLLARVRQPMSGE